MTTGQIVGGSTTATFCPTALVSFFGIRLDRHDGVGEHETICRLSQEEDHAYRIGLCDVTTPNFQPTFNLVSDTTVAGTR